MARVTATVHDAPYTTADPVGAEPAGENGVPTTVPLSPEQRWTPITTAPKGPLVSSATWRAGWRFFKKSFKLGVSMSLDFLDFTIGRLLGFGIAFDLGCWLITAAMWGHRSWWSLWEVVDITEQIDGFIPTCTIIALRSWNDE